MILPVQQALTVIASLIWEELKRQAIVWSVNPDILFYMETVIHVLGAMNVLFNSFVKLSAGLMLLSLIMLV